ncbi:DnaB-like helicase C-terminal domain-containing protein [Flexibacterium corallicola]|uniref:DnaB-like helicase C-terminal domain-containing protein n=1 Tax=Flexibacterium corallicola TaxID=3037259 RepID=UPI00286F8B4D|nr:DnaB-like helicase C-terminal domain-containing protein [Pseudovibrio sp. M1P-2-3]
MPEELLVLGAPSGVGKSALAYGVCEKVALNTGPVFYEQNEMTADQMSSRRLSAITQIPTYKIRTGNLTAEEEEKLYIAAQSLEGMPLHLSAGSTNTIEKVHRKAAAMQARMGLSLIVLDSIKMTAVDDKRMNAPDKLPARCEYVVGYSKFIAKDLSIPVIAIAHDKREARDPLQRIKRDDLYGGGAVEQQADNVIIIHRPEDALKRNEPLDTGSEAYIEWQQRCGEWEGIAELHADKVRMGQANRKAQVYWNGATTTFHENRSFEEGALL